MDQHAGDDSAHAGRSSAEPAPDLREMLRAPASHGVQRWPSGIRSEDVARAATQLGWRVYRLDTRGIDGKRAVIRRFVADLGLPDYTGGNWDALEESLGDLPVGGSSGVVLLWRGWRSFAEAAPEAMDIATQVLTSVADQWRDQTGYGVVALMAKRRPAPDGRDAGTA
ncbi:MAG: barstar family protein [Candidatus Nanopelagicales bacterium]